MLRCTQGRRSSQRDTVPGSNSPSIIDSDPSVTVPRPAVTPVWFLPAEAAAAASAADVGPAWPSFPSTPTENGHLPAAELAEAVRSRPNGGSSSSDSDDGQYAAAHDGGVAAGDLANGAAADPAVAVGGAEEADAWASRHR